LPNAPLALASSFSPPWEGSGEVLPNASLALASSFSPPWEGSGEVPLRESLCVSHGPNPIVLSPNP
ncbi:MAG: hypothetical protein ACFN4W_09885, partial [Segatella oris]